MIKKLFFPSFFFFCYLFTFNPCLGSNLTPFQKSYHIQTDKNLKIILEIDAGKVKINKNLKDGEVNISGKISEKYDDLDIDYNTRYNEISLVLDRNKWLKSAKDDETSILEIKLPCDATIELSTEIKAGEINFELGGLMLYNFELRNFAGEVNVDFSEPNKIKMEFLDVNVKIGNTKLRRLGNARFADATINSGIGELYIDLTGANIQSSKVDIDLDLGSTSVFLPRDLGIKIRSTTMGFLTQSNLDSEFRKRGRYFFSKNFDSAKKIMYVTIHSGIGELRVDLR